MSKRSLAGDDQVDRFRSLALFVRLDIKADALAFVERLHSRTFDRRDVNEHIASAVVRFDEAVDALAIEELDRTTLRHREAPFPIAMPPRPRGSAARPDIPGKSVGTPNHFRQPPMEAERQSQYARD